MLGSKDFLAMSRTGLHFYRKHQALEDLKVERPKSIGAVRQALKQAVEKIETQLRTIERDFYGGATCDEHIRSIKPFVRRLCAAFNLTYIHGAYQIDEVLAECRDDEEEDLMKIDRQTLDRIRDYHFRIKDFVPARFEPLIRDAEEVIGFMEKYLLSYHDGSTDDYMETAVHYEQKRNELKDAILSHLRNITYMSRMYYDKGTPVKVFGLAVNEIARRCDCGDLPFLLVFPQCCQNIRNACQGISKWIESDEEYAGFIACDIVELGRKRKSQLARMRAAQESHFVTEHRLKQVKRELNELEADLEKLKQREKDNQKEVERLESDIQMMSIETEMLEDEREQIKEKQKTDQQMDYSKRLDTIASKISELRFRIPAKNVEISDVKSKISFITDKRQLYEKKLKQLAQLKHDVTYTKMSAAVEEIELDRITRCLEALKYIYLQKTSPASTRHIFHKTPPKVKVHPDKAKSTQGRILKSSQVTVIEEKDELERAAHVVAKKIEGDWPKLYRNLPFYPPRGEHNIDDDVINIVQERMRVADKVKAEESLQKWRRVHTRANVDDLKETLMKMNRKDVIKRIEKRRRQKPAAKNTIQKKWQNLRTLQLITTRISHYKSSRVYNIGNDSTGKKTKFPRILATQNP